MHEVSGVIRPMIVTDLELVALGINVGMPPDPFKDAVD